MKTKILKILRNADGFVSGQAICESLGVSRTAVWKVINQLKEEGYEFDAVSNKGYRIVNYPDILTKSEIESQLDKNDIIKNKGLILIIIFSFSLIFSLVYVNFYASNIYVKNFKSTEKIEVFKKYNLF